LLLLLLQACLLAEEPADILDTSGTTDTADDVVAGAPRAAIHPAAVDFGDLPLGDRVEAVVVLANLGDAPLTLKTADLVGCSSEFELDPTDEAKILPGGSFELVVSYSPADTYGDDGFLRVRTDDPVEDEILVPLTGDGTERR
jgi:hypothetical protein